MHPHTHARSTTTLNIGILAHVDAGKTSLTERLLYDTGVIDRLGSVDGGDTRTDTGEIERQRGITIRSAVASFTVGGVQVNLIDTPGHSDFIAEVERALEVLDGAVLLLSSVEGVQAQTRVLMKTLRRMRLPTLLFLNKIDRAGARDAALLEEIRHRLTPCPVPMTEARGVGTPGARAVPLPLDGGRTAEALAEADEAVLARLVDGPPPGADEVRAALAARTADGSAHPVFHGSALSGEGVAALVDGVTRLVPPAPRDASAPPRGTVFAMRPEGAYLRLYEGEVAPRQRITFLREEAEGRTSRVAGRVTALDVVGDPRCGGGRALRAGGIGVLRGVPGLRVGDRLGARGEHAARFAPPTLETVVSPKDPEQAARLHAALLALAGQDPLIHARPAPSGGTALLLYGEVQKQVLAATLAHEHGIEAEFAPSRTVCLERPVGTGEAYEEIERHAHTGEWATVGLRVEPGERGTGRVFTYETELGALPRAFHQAVEDTVHEALGEGPHGWPVTDCRVTLVRSGYASPVSTAGDFRGVTRRVLARALERAGTRVHEPCHAFEAEIPLDALAAVTSRLAALGAELRETTGGGTHWLLTGSLPASRVREAESRLPSLTRGEGLWWSRPEGDRPLPPDRT
ncbi:tetracycline resistance ribosomal protection protein Otr(A) [Streptomyces sp. NPDC048172]|uniref:tetracycline resistance ribosomal protection protein Otr(A) n=1 Tax=Streptomyces sp. NPDC048172 TaxID=3365505 RepID=UPI00371D2AA3